MFFDDSEIVTVTEELSRGLATEASRRVAASTAPSSAAPSPTFLSSLSSQGKAGSMFIVAVLSAGGAAGAAGAALSAAFRFSGPAPDGPAGPEAPDVAPDEVWCVPQVLCGLPGVLLRPVSAPANAEMRDRPLPCRWAMTEDVFDFEFFFAFDQDGVGALVGAWSLAHLSLGLLFFCEILDVEHRMQFEVLW